MARSTTISFPDGKAYVSMRDSTPRYYANISITIKGVRRQFDFVSNTTLTNLIQQIELEYREDTQYIGFNSRDALSMRRRKVLMNKLNQLNKFWSGLNE